MILLSLGTVVHIANLPSPLILTNYHAIPTEAVARTATFRLGFDALNSKVVCVGLDPDVYFLSCYKTRKGKTLDFALIGIVGHLDCQPVPLLKGNWE